MLRNTSQKPSPQVKDDKFPANGIANRVVHQVASESCLEQMPLAGKIHDATALPPRLISIIHSYCLPHPPAFVILEISRNLKAISLFANQYNWDGISIAVDRRLKSLRCSGPLPDLYKDRDLPKDLSNLTLDRVIFTGLDPAETINIKTHEEVKTELDSWYDVYSSSYSGDGHDAYIKFDKTSLIGARFENMLCASFSFKGAVLTEASLESSILTGADFTDANLQRANLSCCYAATCYYSKRLYPQYISTFFTTKFKNADLTEARLCQGNFNDVVFHAAIMNEAKLNRSSFINAKFYGCLMQSADLTQADFSNAEFAGFYNNGDRYARTNLSNAIAVKANFTNAGFNCAHLQNIDLSEANLTGARFKEAHLQGAKLVNAKFTLDQFTEEQVLSFYYLNEFARLYVKAIFDYMRDNEKHKAKHKKGFVCAEKLILSLIHGQNELLTGFILTGNLPGESIYSSFFSSGENALHTRLQKIKKYIDDGLAVAFHVSRKEK